MEFRAPKLFVIATPLGNRDDITLRAIKALKEIDYFFAEDTRQFKSLLNLYDISLQGKKVSSFAKHNMKQATENALKTLERGEPVGLVTDRGTPAVSDPGAVLVSAAWDRGFTVVPICGPSSVLACFSVSGISDGCFVFVGFLPRKKNEAETCLQSAGETGFPIILFESAKRLTETLQHLHSKFADAKCFIGREITKKFETFYRFSLDDIPTIEEKGEFTIVVQPKVESVTSQDWLEDVALRLKSEKDWAKSLALKHGVASKEIYNALQKMKM